MLNSSFIIRADNDDEYIQFNDYETAQTYRFWSLYGFTPDTNSTYTQTYVTNGTTTESAQISIVGTNHEGGSMSTTITEVMNKVVDAGDNIYDYDIAEVFNEIELEIAGQTNDKRDQMSLHFGACTALGTTPGGGGNYSEYTITCDGSTDNYYYNNSTFEIKAGKTDSSAWIHIFPQTTSYNDSLTGAHHSAVYEGFETEGNHISSISLTETVNESGTISSSGSITTTTTTVNTNSLKYVYPVVSGIVNNDTNGFKNFLIKRDNPFVIIMLIANGSPGVNSLTYYIRDDQGAFNEEDDVKYNYTSEVRAGYRLLRIELYNSKYINKYCRIELDSVWNNVKFIPLFANYKSTMSDGIYRYIYGSDRTIEAINNLNGSVQNVGNKVDNTNDLIENGNSVTDAAIDTSTSITDEFSEVENDYHAAELRQINNMDSALENITTTGGITSNNKFIDASFWVKTQFNRMVNNTPFELMITFSLVLGLALVFIGKLR